MHTTCQKTQPGSAPPLTLHAQRDIRADTQALADRLLGTLRAQPGPHSVAVSDPYGSTLHFHPAWNVQAELDARSRQCTHSAARHAVQCGVRQAALRRASCGRDWHMLSITARATNARGEVLACATMTGLPSDSPHLDEIEASLLTQAHEEALDWAILGLN